MKQTRDVRSCNMLVDLVARSHAAEPQLKRSCVCSMVHTLHLVIAL